MELQQQKDLPIPRYQQIAIDIATKIVNEEYEIDQKIYGRSSIAGQYGVSPETARRAFSILASLGIVSPEKGSGMVIKSRTNAVEFLNQFAQRKTIETLKTGLVQSIARQKKEMEYLTANLTELIVATEHFKSMNPLAPFTIRITSECVHLNKSIQDLQLWQHTGATLVAIKRNDVLLRSPGPYAALFEGDIIYFISQEDSDQKVKEFLFPSK